MPCSPSCRTSSAERLGDPAPARLSRAGAVAVLIALVVPGLAIAGAGDEPQGASLPLPHPGFTVIGRWGMPVDLGYVIEDQGSPLPPGRFESVIRRALELWQQTGAVRFRELTAGAAQERPSVVFAWRERRHDSCPPFIGWCGSLAHATPPGSGAFVHFNRREVWSEEGAEFQGLLAAALHEVGHVLGLGHSPEPTAVMHEKPAPRRNRLTEHDLAGLHSLYGGGSVSAGDLWLSRLRTDGGVAPTATVLRRLAPEGVEVGLLDVDGDGGAEILTWPTDPKDITIGLGIWHLDGRLRLQRSQGPAPGIIDPARPVIVGRVPGGPALLVQLLGADGRYRAARFSDKGLPVSAWRAGAFVLENDRGADADGDGTFEVPDRRWPEGLPEALVKQLAGWKTVARAGVGYVLVASDGAPRRHRVLWNDAQSWRLGPIFRVAWATLGDLDGDGRPEVVTRGRPDY